MATLNPYLNYPGTAEEAFTHYKKVFGGEYNIVRYKDTPENGETASADAEKAMHIALPVGKSNVLMATDLSCKRMGDYKPGNDFYLSVFADSEEEADRLFNGLAEGGTITMPMEKTFWNAYFGMLKDKWGIHWMVNHDYNQAP
ncbi:MAG TPA: VOC family protein [Chitinophaga sp.]